MNFPETITSDEKKVIEKLKDRTLQDCTPKMLEDPYIFYRFSKAREFNLKQAEFMLRKHIDWRHKYNIDTILTDYTPQEVLKKYTPYSMLGFDKEGSPVRYVNVSGTDNKGLFRSATKTDFIKFYFQNLELDTALLLQQSQKLKKPITKVIYIMDFNNISLSKATHRPTIEVAMMTINMFQDNYPERIKSIYIINNSLYFNVFLSMVKMVILTEVMKKIKHFGTDGWKEALLEIISPDVLPAFLGGQRTDPDGNPLCNSFINHGGMVPEHYYLSKFKRMLSQKPGVKKLIVMQFSSANLTFDVNKSGSFLEWDFETKNGDICFGIYFNEKSLPESEVTEIVPKQRIDTCTEPETGMYKCEKPGLYIILFDNSYSWIRSKEIYYVITILPPPEQEASK